MGRKYLITFALILTINSISAQENTLGTVYITEEVNSGLTIFSSRFDTYIIDNCGRVVNKWNSDFRVGQSAYLLEEGQLLRTGTESLFGYGHGGVIELFDWDGNLLWQDKFNSDILALHHDIQPLPNGNILAIAYAYKTKEEAWNAGAQDSVEYYVTTILEIMPIGIDSSDIVWKWELWDHLIQDVDSTRNNFGNIEGNPQLFDLNRRDFSGLVNGYSDANSDLMHMNSIDYNVVTDEILLSSRDQYEIFIIDHSTTQQEAAGHVGGNGNKGGDFLYRFGSGLYGQHDVHWANGDTIVLFNNGFKYDDQSRGYASVDRLVPKRDPSNAYIYYEVEQNEVVISSYEQDYQFFSEIMGSGQILQDGNILVCDSDDGIFYEFNKHGEITWTYANPFTSNGINTQGNSPSSNPLIFRAKKISKEDSRLAGLDLTPQDPIELDFDIQMCLDLTGVKDLNVSNNVTIFPNPASDRIEIKSDVEIEQIMIYDTNGTLVKRSGANSSIDISKLLVGFYYVIVRDKKGESLAAKLIKI